MQIYGSAPRVIDRSQWGSGGSTYESANKVGSHPADSALGARATGGVPETVRDAALSALRNERFGTMLATISDPRSSDAVMRMSADASGAGTGTDHGSVFAAYGESS